jgi:hypothetical protein
MYRINICFNLSPLSVEDTDLFLLGIDHLNTAPIETYSTELRSNPITTNGPSRLIEFSRS